MKTNPDDLIAEIWDNGEKFDTVKIISVFPEWVVAMSLSTNFLIRTSINSLKIISIEELNKGK